MSKSFILFAFLLWNCHQAQDQAKSNAPLLQEKIKSIRITVFSSETTSAQVYDLTSDEVKVVWDQKEEYEPDSLIFIKKLKSTDRFTALGSIEFKKRSYHNPCMADGLMMLVEFRNDTLLKQVYLTNYYLPIVDQAVNLVNKELPNQFRIEYNKGQLLKDEANCNIVDINEPAEGYPYPNPPPPLPDKVK